MEAMKTATIKRKTTETLPRTKDNTELRMRL